MEPAEKSQEDVREEHVGAPPGLGNGPSHAPRTPTPPSDSIGPIPTNTSNHENAISLREVDPVSVQLDCLSVTVDESPNLFQKAFSKKRRQGYDGAADHVKTILDSISAEMPSGSLAAIIGGSGSGKTSLLNQMSGRMHGKRLSASGRTLFNGSEDPAGVRSAYVIQQDILLPTLTVRETLTYAAHLRLPPSVSKQEREQLVEEVIMELSLKEAADTRIGNHEHRGCSGGEKRRTSIGVQLLSNPSLLWLDEPTTGLDSTSAFQVVKTLQNLARKGRTVIVTIHQPRSEIWNLFDNIILLTRGSPAYAGSAKDCLPYFSNLGYELRPFVNPAEFLIDIVSIDNRSSEAEQEAQTQVQRIKEAWREHQSKSIHPSNSEERKSETEPSAKQLRSKQTSLFQQIQVLTARTFIVTIRDPMGMFGSLVEAISMGVIMGWIFLQLDGSLSGIRSRQGALYIASALQGYLILLYETYRLTTDIQLFDEESRQGVVSIPAFLISRRLARIWIEDVPVPLIFSLIFYFMTGFRTDGIEFMTFFSVILLEQYIAVCFAAVCVAVSRNFAGASLVANLVYTLQSMASGFFIQSNTTPIYVRWTKWTAYVFYAFGALAANEFTGSFYDCPLGDASNPACKEYTGQYILDSLGFPRDWVWRPILALFGFVVAFFLGAAVVLKFWSAELVMARARPSNSDDSAGKEKMTARSVEEVRSITIRLEGYGLDVEKRSLRKRNTKVILNPLTAEFQPGTMNVIMGPSGSGKTSLLNSMAGRLRDDLSTQYKKYGQMTFNGLAPSEDVVHAICSFVTQDDDALLASLTVRETLRYAAGLRLPKWMTKEQKIQRAEDVLLKMGLKDCADNLIGNDLIKGISGGEKRRVTIAVQILTEPRILLLDEPLSGLDAFTALSIMDVLRGLANEGRTLLVTIHQPRSDLFVDFGHLLLLARGGHPVYAGPAKDMLTHFAAQGDHCSKTTNPADFALDLITVDLQHESKEAASRAKVNRLIKSWTSDMFPAAHTGSIATPAELGSLARVPAPFILAFPILMRRATKNFFRQPGLLAARIGQVVGLGIVLTLFFAPLKNDYFAVQNRLGFIVEIAPLYFVGMLNNIAVYPSERDVFYRDYDDRAYGVEAFFLTYTMLEIPFEIFSGFIFAVLTVLGCGLEKSAQIFFIIVFNAFCIVSCGESLGIAFTTLFTHTGFSVNCMSVFLSVAQCMAGVISVSIPSFLQALNHLSPVKWAVGNMAPYTLRSQTFTCEDWQRLPNGNCPLTTGKEVLKLYNLDSDPDMNLMALGICAIVYRLTCYIILKCAKERWLGRLWRKAAGGKNRMALGSRTPQVSAGESV